MSTVSTVPPFSKIKHLCERRVVKNSVTISHISSNPPRVRVNHLNYKVRRECIQSAEDSLAM